MTTKFKNLLTLALAAGLLYGLLIWALVRPADTVSASERRPLAQRPELTWQAVQSGSFMDDFSAFSLDQFPLRESFRAVHTLAQLHLFGQKDVHGLYSSDGQIAKLEYPLNTDSVNYALSRFTYIYNTYLKGTNCKIYAAAVPDKSYYLAAANGYPAMDYDALFSQLQDGMPYAAFRDLTKLLTADDYYATDAHWRQECLQAVAAALAAAMHTDLADTNYTPVTLPQPFYGVYAGQVAIPFPADSITLLQSSTLEDCTVYDYETDAALPVYDLTRADGSDPYEVYLSGSKSLLRLENPHAATDRELILFRDSFGSSLAPLLASGYKTITLVDIRYLAPERLARFLTFENQDVLFLYSTSVLNHSETLK